MRDMARESYKQALRESLMPKWLSMNTMMSGMVPTMVRLMMGTDMRTMDQITIRRGAALRFHPTRNVADELPCLSEPLSRITFETCGRRKGAAR